MEGSRQGLAAPDHHVIITLFRVQRHHSVGGGAQPTPNAIPGHRLADLSACRKPDADRLLGVPRCRASSQRNWARLENQAGGDPFSAIPRDPKELRPPLQARDRARHRPRPKGACASWPAVARAHGGPRRWPCGYESRAGACERLRWVGRCASPLAFAHSPDCRSAGFYKCLHGPSQSWRRLGRRPSRAHSEFTNVNNMVIPPSFDPFAVR